MTASQSHKQGVFGIRQDPDVQAIMSRLPAETADALTDQQLRHIRTAIGTGQWRKHRVDLRGTIPVPFFPSRIYFVFLMGRNRREISRRELHISWMASFLMIVMFLLFSTTLGLFTLYIVKSALGIDLLPSTSTGIWDWFRALFA